MKKLQIFILILVVIALFAFADYSLNLPGGIPRPTPSLPSFRQDSQTEKPPEIVTHPNITKLILELSGQQGIYTIEKRSRSTELFESFDLSDLANTSIYKNILINAETKGQLPIYVYEIHGPAGQGNITYLNIKLAMIDQLGSAAGINETGDLGFSSLYYNDESSSANGFLLSQIGDIVFGFKYSKQEGPAFDFIKTLINTYMSQISNTN